MIPSVNVIGHRGASAYTPENTLSAFKQALDMGCHYIEFDVMLSEDGVPFVFHDETLERTSNGHGALEGASADYLMTLDAGRWFSHRFLGEKIPRLDEVLLWLIENEVFANIEIKPSPLRRHETTTAVMTLLHQTWPRDAQMPLISSFDHEVLYLCRALNPDLPIGVLFEGWQDNWLHIAKSLNATSIHFNKEALTPRRVQEIKAENYLLYVYTVNQTRLKNKLLSWGVDAIFSDYPDI